MEENMQQTYPEIEQSPQPDKRKRPVYVVSVLTIICALIAGYFVSAKYYLYTWPFEKIIEPTPIISELVPTPKLKNDPEPNTYNWCMANNGEDITPNYNAPKKCLLDRRIYEENCVDNDKYFVISNNLSENIGLDLIIKSKTSTNQIIPCKYLKNANDLEIKSQDPEFIVALENEFLITDIGTGPGPRGLTIYDLNKNEKIYTDNHLEILNVRNDTIEYWRSTDQTVTAENCPELDKWTSEGLGAGIDSRVILDLLNLSKKELGEYRCTPRQ